MASPIHKKLAKHLECPICLEKFTEPKVLSCQHSYCRMCLERLVRRLGRDDYEVTCPECRKNTKVPGGDINSLPPNFLINNLLSLHHDHEPSKTDAICAKHDGETLKLFCQTCEEPICRDCTIIDHLGHRYSFIKDLFVAEKEKTLKLVQESRATISALESTVETVVMQEDKLKENLRKVQQCIDSFINTQIEILKVQGEHLKNELQKPILNQEEIFQTQKDSLFLSLGCLKSSVEFIEKELSGGNEVAVLTAKGQLSKQLNQATVLANIKPRDTIFYTLQLNTPLNNETVNSLAHISKYKEEYKLSMCGGNFGQLDETYVNLKYVFVISKEKVFLRDYIDVLSPFSLNPKSINPTGFDPSIHKDRAQVRIMSPRSRNHHSMVIGADKERFLFSYCPDEIGTYTIEIIVNGRYIPGCPFAWPVKGVVTPRNYTKMEDE
ncbi:tripartite motif-containing protein 2-like [Montipora capricornis]|uniref:tripartite motif-containing protein 2-like n=1 Tax=Montipora capricornis TaxID=246305 RepID=UPI0035F11BEF